MDKIYDGRGRVPSMRSRTSHGCAKRRIVALLGSSGCSKTSTLRMIAGFEESRTGTRARRPTGRSAAACARKVAMAFEGYSLYPPLTVRENIAFALNPPGCRPRMRRTGPTSRASSKSNRSSIDIRTRFRADSSSAQRWLGRSYVRRISISWTNPWGSSTPAARGPARPAEKPFGRSPHDRDLCHARPDRSQRAG